MPYPILEDIPDKPYVEKKPKQIEKDSPTLFEKFLTLVIAWQFFHFTGKAIANGQKLPRNWLKIKDRILPKKVKELLGETAKEKTPTSYKVVDLATKEAIKVQ